MLFANMESDHISIRDRKETVAKITDADSYNAFVDSFKGEGSIICSSSMDFPFDYTTNLNLVLLANQFTGNTITTPDRYYQPIPNVRDEHEIAPNQFWIMEENGIKEHDDIPKEEWLCYYEEEIGEGVTVVLMDATPQTLELQTV